MDLNNLVAVLFCGVMVAILIVYHRVVVTETAAEAAARIQDASSRVFALECKVAQLEFALELRRLRPAREPEPPAAAPAVPLPELRRQLGGGTGVVRFNAEGGIAESP